MSTKSTTEKTEWPTIEEQESYWRTKEADLSLDKVEATTDYYDHFLDANTDSDRSFPSNETDLSGGETNVVSLSVGAGSARCATPSIGRATDEGGRQAAQNSHLSIEDRKAPSDSTLAEP